MEQLTREFECIASRDDAESFEVRPFLSRGGVDQRQAEHFLGVWRGMLAGSQDVGFKADFGGRAVIFNSMAHTEMVYVPYKGLAGYETGSWYGILAPAMTGAHFVGRLNLEINKALNTPKVRAKLKDDGAEPIDGTPRAFADHNRSELDRMRLDAKDIKLD